MGTPSVRTDPVINAILAKKAEVALEALERPVGQDLFAYGRLVGIIAGLNMAHDLVVEMIADRHAKDI